MILINRRRAAQGGSPATNYLMTATSNPEVFALCLAQGWCSSEGMTYEEAAAVTSLGNAFGMNNNDITHFEEFEYFTNVTQLLTNSFRGATNLKRIVFPDSLTRIAGYCFNYCGIEEYDTKNVDYISTSSFQASDSVKKIRIGSALNVTYNPFSSKSLVAIEVDSENEYYETDDKVLIYKSTKTLVITTNDVSDIPEGVEVIGSSSMREIQVNTLTLPSTVNSIGVYFLYHSSVTNLISKAVVPPAAAANTFTGATITNIYVPDAQVNDYKADANWSAYASKIKGLSEFIQPT